MNQKLPKSEILRNAIHIQELFSKNSSPLYVYPFKLFYLVAPSPEDLKFPEVLFVVPKKKFRKATARNYIRRRIKEAYRLNKSRLCTSSQNSYIQRLAIVYIGNEKPDFAFIEQKLLQALDQLLQQFR